MSAQAQGRSSQRKCDIDLETQFDLLILNVVCELEEEMVQILLYLQTNIISLGNRIVEHNMITSISRLSRARLILVARSKLLKAEMLQKCK